MKVEKFAYVNPHAFTPNTVENYRTSLSFHDLNNEKNEKKTPYYTHHI